MCHGESPGRRHEGVAQRQYRSGGQAIGGDVAASTMGLRKDVAADRQPVRRSADAASVASVMRRRLSGLWIHIVAGLLLLATRVLLPLAGLRRTLVVLAGRSPRAARGGDEEYRLRCLRAVRRVAVFLPGSSCLAQSVALVSLVSRRGVGCDLVVGCARSNAGWIAHAWVEGEGGWRLEPTLAGPQHELARCRLGHGWRLCRSSVARLHPCP